MDFFSTFILYFSGKNWNQIRKMIVIRLISSIVELRKTETNEGSFNYYVYMKVGMLGLR